MPENLKEVIANRSVALRDGQCSSVCIRSAPGRMPFRQVSRAECAPFPDMGFTRPCFGVSRIRGCCCFDSWACLHSPGGVSGLSPLAGRFACPVPVATAKAVLRGVQVSCLICFGSRPSAETRQIPERSIVAYPARFFSVSRQDKEGRAPPVLFMVRGGNETLVFLRVPA